MGGWGFRQGRREKKSRMPSGTIAAHQVTKTKRNGKTPSRSSKSSDERDSWRHHSYSEDSSEDDHPPYVIMQAEMREPRSHRRPRSRSESRRREAEDEYDSEDNQYFNSKPRRKPSRGRRREVYHDSAEEEKCLQKATKKGPFMSGGRRRWDGSHSTPDKSQKQTSQLRGATSDNSIASGCYEPPAITRSKSVQTTEGETVESVSSEEIDVPTSVVTQDVESQLPDNSTFITGLTGLTGEYSGGFVDGGESLGNNAVSNFFQGDHRQEMAVAPQMLPWKYMSEEGPILLRAAVFSGALSLIGIDLYCMTLGAEKYDFTVKNNFFAAITYACLSLALFLEGRCICCLNPVGIRSKIRMAIVSAIPPLKFVWARGILCIFAGAFQVAQWWDIMIWSGAAMVVIGALEFGVGVFAALQYEALRGVLVNDSFLEFLFHRFDYEGDGTLTLADFASFLATIGLEFDDMSVMAAFETIDTEKRGRISFQQFKDWWYLSIKRKVPPPTTE